VARVARWYAKQGVAFDSRRGLDVDRVVREHQDWAEANGMLPSAHRWNFDRRASSDSPQRARALFALGSIYARLGAYERAIEVERELVRLRPATKVPRRRLVYDLLRVGRLDDAVAEARALQALDRGDARSRGALDQALEYARLSRTPKRSRPPARILLDFDLNP
jgi:tetratricopeptide (TPR) repeat protein